MYSTLKPAKPKPKARLKIPNPALASRTAGDPAENWFYDAEAVDFDNLNGNKACYLIIGIGIAGFQFEFSGMTHARLPKSVRVKNYL